MYTCSGGGGGGGEGGGGLFKTKLGKGGLVQFSK